MRFVSFSDKAIRNILILLWGFIIIWGFISYTSPKLFFRLGTEGRTREAQTAIQRGNYFAEKGHFLKAFRYYQEANSIAPFHAISLVLMADMQYRIGETRKAIGFYQQAVAKSPNLKATVYHRLAEIYFATGQDKTALKYFTKARAADTFELFPYNKNGEYYIYIQQWDSAIIQFRKALEMSGSFRYFYTEMMKKEVDRYPFRPEIQFKIKTHIKTGVSQLLLRNYDSLIFSRYQLSDKNIALTYNQLGYAYIMAGNKAEAESCFLNALRSDPDFTQAELNLKHLRESR